MAKSNKDLSGYSSVAQKAISAGLKTGHVRFEDSAEGGEYIYSSDKTFGANKAPISKAKQILDNIKSNVNGAMNVVGGAVVSAAGVPQAGVPMFRKGMSTFTGKSVSQQNSDASARGAKVSKAFKGLVDRVDGYLPLSKNLKK